MSKLNKKSVSFLIAALIFSNCSFFNPDEKPKPRLTMFVGVDISGSFMNTGYYEDALDFLAHYLYSHLNGIGGLEVPNALFVSSIGGDNANEPKTFFPIQTFEHKSIEEISTTLHKLFPRSKSNAFTDYNAFFEQCAATVKNKNLVLRPISIVMLSDGKPDVIKDGETDFSSLDVSPLEKLARNVTIRLLYTDAVVGANWQKKVKRKRVKVWTQDAEVMVSWKDPKIMLADTSLEAQPHFYAWIQDNVDFGVRSRRVD
jgi:hypothetical protein